MKRAPALFSLIFGLLASCDLRGPGAAPIPYSIISQLPHDPSAYTQGLQFHQSRLWESTGLYGQSSVREVNPLSGDVVRKRMLPPNLFGEGLTLYDGELWVITWRENTALALDPETFETKRTTSYPGEGWGLTSDGRHLIMSDGTSILRFFRPDDFSLVRTLPVTSEKQPVNNLNELEYVNGMIFANIYLTDRIARIDARTGKSPDGWTFPICVPCCPRPIARKC